MREKIREFVKDIVITNLNYGCNIRGGSYCCYKGSEVDDEEFINTLAEDIHYFIKTNEISLEIIEKAKREEREKVESELDDNYKKFKKDLIEFNKQP